MCINNDTNNQSQANESYDFVHNVIMLKSRRYIFILIGLLLMLMLTAEKEIFCQTLPPMANSGVYWIEESPAIILTTWGYPGNIYYLSDNSAPVELMAQYDNESNYAFDNENVVLIPGRNGDELFYDRGPDLVQFKLDEETFSVFSTANRYMLNISENHLLRVSFGGLIYTTDLDTYATEIIGEIDIPNVVSYNMAYPYQEKKLLIGVTVPTGNPLSPYTTHTYLVNYADPDGVPLIVIPLSMFVIRWIGALPILVMPPLFIDPSSKLVLG